MKRILPDDQQSLLELYTDEAVKFITGHKAAPFLRYLAPNAVHFPTCPGKKWAGKSPHGYYSDWVEEVDWSVGSPAQRQVQAGAKSKFLSATNASGLALLLALLCLSSAQGQSITNPIAQLKSHILGTTKLTAAQIVAQGNSIQANAGMLPGGLRAATHQTTEQDNGPANPGIHEVPFTNFALARFIFRPA